MITISGATLSGGYSLQYEVASTATTRGSLSFSGSNNVSVTNSAVLNPGTGDFTIEFWVYLNSVTNNSSLYRGSNSGVDVFINGVGRLAVGQAGISTLITDTVTLSSGTWLHVAAVRISGTTKLYKNGTQVGSAGDSTNYVTSTTTTIGTGSSSINGYMSNLRVVIGLGIYTGAFNPPTSPLTVTQSSGINITAIAAGQTQLLLNTTYDANFLKDSSTNNFTLTNNGNVTSNSAHPFTPGSGTFNVTTTNQTFQIPINSLFTYGTGDFTVEWWSRQTSASGVQGIWRNSTGDATNSIGYWTIQQPSQRLTITFGNGTSSNTILSNTTVPLNTWHHYAIVRNGTLFTLYLDGVAQTQTMTSSISLPAQVGIMQIGNAGGQYSGFVTNFRIVKGTAVYTSDFTVPTTPLTAIANTSLLLSFYSAGLLKDSSPNNITITNASGVTYNVATPFTFTS